jgi:Protein of unknown function (DUF642)/Fibronectin type III domain
VLSHPAGTGGRIVSLTTSSPNAVVPPTVIIPAGASRATFLISTLPVTTAAPVTITAGAASGAATAVLQLLPLVDTPATGPNLLVNGSFETPAVPVGGFSTFAAGSLPGWRITRGTVDVLNKGSWQAAPGQGEQSLDLVGSPGAATIEQSFPTEVGRDYLFSGYLSHNPGVAFGRADILLSGAAFVQLAHNLRNTNAEMKWQFFSYRFHATAAITTLTISDATGIDNLQGTALDGLSVMPAGDSTPPTNAAAPAAPTGLAARSVGADRVNLTWSDNSSNERAFAIWRKSGGADWARVGVVPPNSTTFTDTGVKPATTYTYRMRATNQFASDWSNEVTVTTR